MRKTGSTFLFLALFLLGLGVGTAASPAQAQMAKLKPVTVAVIDVQGVMRGSAAAKAIRGQIDKIRADYQTKVTEQEKALRKEEQDLAQQRAILAPDVFETKLREFKKKVADIQRSVQARKRQLDQGFGNAMKKVRSELIKIVAKIAEEVGAGVVLAKDQIVLAEKSLDLSKEAMARLNKALPTVKVVLPPL